MDKTILCYFIFPGQLIRVMKFGAINELLVPEQCYLANIKSKLFYGFSKVQVHDQKMNLVES